MNIKNLQTHNDVADFILDIRSEVEQLPPNEQIHVIEGGVHRLWKLGVDEWELYKVYTYWSNGKLIDTENATKFAKIMNVLEEFHGQEHILRNS